MVSVVMWLEEAKRLRSFCRRARRDRARSLANSIAASCDAFRVTQMIFALCMCSSLMFPMSIEVLTEQYARENVRELFSPTLMRSHNNSWLFDPMAISVVFTYDSTATEKKNICLLLESMCTKALRDEPIFICDTNAYSRFVVCKHLPLLRLLTDSSSRYNNFAIAGLYQKIVRAHPFDDAQIRQLRDNSTGFGPVQPFMAMTRDAWPTDVQALILTCKSQNLTMTAVRVFTYAIAPQSGYMQGVEMRMELLQTLIHTIKGRRHDVPECLLALSYQLLGYTHFFSDNLYSTIFNTDRLRNSLPVYTYNVLLCDNRLDAVDALLVRRQETYNKRLKIALFLARTCYAQVSHDDEVIMYRANVNIPQSPTSRSYIDVNFTGALMTLFPPTETTITLKETTANVLVQLLSQLLQLRYDRVEEAIDSFLTLADGTHVLARAENQTAFINTLVIRITEEYAVIKRSEHRMQLLERMLHWLSARHFLSIWPVLQTLCRDRWYAAPQPLVTQAHKERTIIQACWRMRVVGRYLAEQLPLEIVVYIARFVCEFPEESLSTNAMAQLLLFAIDGGEKRRLNRKRKRSESNTSIITTAPQVEQSIYRLLLTVRQ